MSARRRADDPALHGVLLVDKPAGPTSHDVVGWVRWVLGLRRVGHCGTLDPAATGLLVVAVGAATKLAPYLTGQDKGYRARFVLGSSTTTADAVGDPVDVGPCPPDTEARVPAALAALRGTLSLPPPAYSAIHVEGQRAHALARAGQAPTLDERPMTVHAVEPGAVSRHGDRVEVEANLLVSKGTYIRSLAEALGRRLGLPAHLGALHRTRSGAFDVQDPRAVTGLSAHQVQTLRPGAPRWRVQLGACETAAAAAEHLRAKLITPAQAVPLPVWRVSDDECGHHAMARLAAGQALLLPDPGLPGPYPPEVEHLAVVPHSGPALVVARVQPGPDGVRLRPERVVVAPIARP